jgi:Protein of unknown function (DUF1761)
MLNFGVNWLAVVIAAVVSFVVGAIWYTVFAKPWQKGVGLSDKDLKEGMLRSYGGSFVLFLVIAWAVAVALKSIGWGSFNDAVWVGFVIGLVGASATIINHLYGKKSTQLIAIDGVFQLFNVIIMAIILYVMK